MTLMTQGNSEGSRRCDARCYNATDPRCDCICGGANHGKGLQQARENTREIAKTMLAGMEARSEGAQRVHFQAMQQELFG